MARTSKQNIRTARLLSRLRFGPELGALAQLFSDARSQRDLSLRNARGGAQSLIASLDQIRPQVQQTYATAGQQREAGFGEANAAMAGLPSGGVVDAIRAGMAREAAGAQSRASEALTRDVTEIDRRKAAAQHGAVFEAREARGQYRQDAAKLANRLREIAGEQGAFVETQLTDLTKQDQDAAIKEFNARTSRMSAQTTRANARETARHNEAVEGETGRHNKAMENKPGAGKDRKARFDPKEKRDTKGLIRIIQGWGEEKKPKPGQGASLEQFLTKKFTKTYKKPADPFLIHVAAVKAIYGRIEPKHRKQLIREYGIGGF